MFCEHIPYHTHVTLLDMSIKLPGRFISLGGPRFAGAHKRYCIALVPRQVVVSPLDVLLEHRKTYPESPSSFPPWMLCWSSLTQIPQVVSPLDVLLSHTNVAGAQKRPSHIVQELLAQSAADMLQSQIPWPGATATPGTPPPPQDGPRKAPRLARTLSNLPGQSFTCFTNEHERMRAMVQFLLLQRDFRVFAFLPALLNFVLVGEELFAKHQCGAGVAGMENPLNYAAALEDPVGNPVGLIRMRIRFLLTRFPPSAEDAEATGHGMVVAQGARHEEYVNIFQIKHSSRRSWTTTCMSLPRGDGIASYRISVSQIAMYEIASYMGFVLQ